MAKGANRRTAFELYHINPNDVKNSKSWFDEQIKFLSTKKVTPNRLMIWDGGRELTSYLMPGKLYFFYYDPKYKDTLPYYDYFPMVLPYDKDDKGFIGLNLHYLDYKPRMMLFKALVKEHGKGIMTEKAKIQYSWDLIKGVSKMKFAQACIKRYLFSHVKSPYLAVPEESWYTAMMLPVQRFVGAKKEQVWADSAQFKSW
jgi:hypothetical protein